MRTLLYVFFVVCSFRLHAQIEMQADSSLLADSLLTVEEVADSTVSPEIVQERLAKLQRTIPLRYHQVTNQFVDYFIYRKPFFTKAMLEKKDIYFPMYEAMLKKYGLPDELKYLSLIESGLNPRAISYAGAGGLWQFMPRTGREFGLKQDAYFDERFNPEKATEASCRYMKQLYRIFGDWEMVLAAYNTGPGNVKRAMRVSGGNSFWSIYNALPKQTRHYVPQYVAILYMMHYHADHGIFPEKAQYSTLTDTVQVSGYFNLFTFAKLANMSMEEIYTHNPQIISTELPQTSLNYALKIPSNYMEHINTNRVAIWDSASKLPFDPATLLAEANDSTATKQVKVGGIVAASDEDEDPETIVARKPKKLYHVVRKNENLTTIAKRYGVNQYDLKRWNKIKSNKLLRGKRLLVLVETGKKHKISSSAITKKAKIKLRFHKVQRGDTLFAIARRYGVDVNRLKKLNKIKGNGVKFGQKLRLV